MFLLLVDGNNVASRARYTSLASLSTLSGEPSGVLCGILKSIQWARSACAALPQNTIVFWDGGSAAGRLRLCPEYKSGRHENPTEEELREREKYIQQIREAVVGLSYLGIRSVSIPGVEADDLISIFASQQQSQGNSSIIYSNDKDFHQLVSDSVLILNPHTEEFLQKQDICLKWGVVDPKLVPELRAIIGDSSDGIKGVKGLGEKKAGMIFPFRRTIFDDSPLPEGPLGKAIATARAGKEVIERNLKLMRLPSNWSESFYDETVAAEAERQFQMRPERDIRKFIEFCERWEFSLILDHISHW